MQINKDYIYWFPFICILIAIFILSHQSQLPYIHLDFEYSDKVKHFIAYFSLGICFNLAMLKMGKLKLKQLIIINFVICSLYGASDEFHQSFIQGRQADVYDWIADSLGGLSSSLFIPLLNNKLNHKFNTKLNTKQNTKTKNQE